VPTWYSANKAKFFAPKIREYDQGVEYHIHFESELSEDDTRQFFIGVWDKNSEENTMKLLLYGNLFPEEYKPIKVQLNEHNLENLLIESALDSLHLNRMKKLSLGFKSILQKIGSVHLRYLGIVDDGQQIFVRYYWRYRNFIQKLGGFGIICYFITIIAIFSKLPLDLMTLLIALSIPTFTSRLLFAIFFPIVLEMILIASFPQASYLILEIFFSQKAKALGKSLELNSYSDNAWAINAIMSEKSKFNFKKNCSSLCC
jgi:hypothetical protein